MPREHRHQSHLNPFRLQHTYERVAGAVRRHGRQAELLEEGPPILNPLIAIEQRPTSVSAKATAGDGLEPERPRTARR